MRGTMMTMMISSTWRCEIVQEKNDITRVLELILSVVDF